MRTAFTLAWQLTLHELIVCGMINIVESDSRDLKKTKKTNSTHNNTNKQNKQNKQTNSTVPLDNTIVLHIHSRAGPGNTGTNNYCCHPAIITVLVIILIHT